MILSKKLTTYERHSRQFPYLSIFIKLNKKETIISLLNKRSTIILSTMKFDRHNPKMNLSKENDNLWKTFTLSLRFHGMRKKRFIYIKPTVINHLIYFVQHVHSKVILF